MVFTVIKLGTNKYERVLMKKKEKKLDRDSHLCIHMVNDNIND